MPNIRTFDAGDATFHPSEAGSAAFREAGGVAAHMASAAGEQYRQAGRAIGAGLSALGSVADREQQHTDAMAEIDFQHQLTQNEIAAQGGVNLAGTPKTSDGQPLFDNPGRGVNQSLPPDASVPSPGQFSAAASKTIDDHSDFLDNLVGRMTGTTVSPQAIKRMQAAADKSKERLELHANAVAGEVAFNHATTTTEQTINSTYGALSRGEMGLPDAIDHINGALDTFQGSLSGDVAAKGSKLIEKKRADAVEQAIKTSINADLSAGHPENAMRTLNDPRWDQYIGGDRDALGSDIANFQKAHAQQQQTQAKLQEVQQKQAALARTDSYVTDAASDNPKMKLQDIWTDPAYANRPDLRKEAVGVVETMRKFNAQDLNVSPQVSHSTTLDLMSRMTAADGDPNKITDRRPIDQAFIDGKMSKDDYKFSLQQFGQLSKPAENQLAKTRDDFFKRYERTIDSNRADGGAPSALGDQNLYKAKQEAIRQEQDLRTKGQDPASLYDPSSPNFFGRPENIMRYHTSMTDEQTFQKQVQQTGTFQAPEQHFASVRTNNPGAQWPNGLAERFGSTGFENLRDGNKIAKFPTPVHGAAANMALLSQKYVGLTVGQAETKWSGGHRSGLPGYSKDTVITKEMANDPKFMIPFMKATANAEAPRGANALTDANWSAAFNMYQSVTQGSPQAAAAPQAASAAPPQPTFRPPANWMFSASRQQFRDPSGKVYDMTGNPVK